jgi:6-pyruvoyltetrahydropterin/6-carboxytetrahydropterin synthase
MIAEISRKYSFAAAHRLHSPRLSDEENRAVYGKCNNPFGHGHDYEVEVRVRGCVNPRTGQVVAVDALDRIAETTFLRPLRFRDLNEIEAFRNTVPTTENLASEIFERLRTAWDQIFGADGPRLESVRIAETDRNICEIRANR